MRHKIIIGLITILLLISTTSYFEIFSYCEASNSVLPKIYVDLNYDSTTPGWNETHFNSIQLAIDNASIGDRIIVYNGEYKEIIFIDKRIALFGEDAEKTIINAEGVGDVVTINISGVDLSTFTIKNSGSAETEAGVKVNADNCRIIDNIISDCRNGIFINSYNETTIAYNTIKDNEYGIFLSSSSDNNLEYNNIYGNSYDGIFLNETCNENQIVGNDIYSNSGGNGIYFNNNCDGNYLADNTIYSNGIIGVRIENSSNNEINNGNVVKLHSSYYGIMIVGNNNSVKNSIIQDNKHGIFLLADNYTIIYKNTIKENTLDGIRLQNSTGNTIYTNTITDNERYGVYVNYFSINNKIYDNYFADNEYNAWDISTSDNSWDKSSTGKNIIGGSKIGGNFWDDYTGVDANKDGIGDTAYNILPASKKDNKPLVSRNPTANAGGTYTVYLGETITFDGSSSSDPDGNTLTYAWNFGDGTTGTGEKPTHKYTDAGEYDVVLTVTNSYDKTDTDETKAIILTDTQPPVITIEKYGPSDDYPNSFTFKVKVTDNTEVSKVYIEYWYADSEKMTADMDKTASYYQKMITPPTSVDKVYCVIYANDTSENQANTKNPYAKAGGPYSGFIGKDIEFNGSESFDLDGNITIYSWDFGDGTTLEGETVKKSYSTNGRYSIQLTVTDDEGNTNTDTTYATISMSHKVETSTTILNQINEKYDNLNLSELFYAYDIDGDDIADTFIDPNNKLKTVIPGYLNLSDNIVFLLSINDDYLPEFFWNSTTNKIIEIKNEQKNNVYTQETGDIAITSVQINKTTGWICLNIKDEYTYATVTVKANDYEIPSERIWRKDNQIYVLDDPETTYTFTYNGIIIPEVLEYIKFYPLAYSTIGQDNPTITISCNTEAIITYADFYNRNTEDTIDIIDLLETSDYKTYTYTPDNTLENGEYEIWIKAKDKNENEKENSSVYLFEGYEIQEESILNINNLIMIGTIIFIAVAIFILSKKLNITFESFIYFRDRKIIPFIKPIIFGPLKIDVNDEKISKAEFYLNGELKDTLTEAPYTWKFDEPSFMKHKIETVVYDQKGNSSSSGEMTFYILNPHFFR